MEAGEKFYSKWQKKFENLYGSKNKPGVGSQ
jgi:hypothetical protein